MPRRRNVGLVVAVPMLAGIGLCFLLAPPRGAPAYDGARPVPADDGRYVVHREVVAIDVTVEEYDAWAQRADLNAILTGDGSLPSVVRTEMIRGEWDEVGARRRVVLSDGHYAAEEVIASERPRLFRYQVWDYTNYAKLATDYAVGEFIAEEVDGKTRLIWTYSFHERSPLTARFLRSFVGGTWGPYMKNVIVAMKAAAERSVGE